MMSFYHALIPTIDNCLPPNNRKQMKQRIFNKIRLKLYRMHGTIIKEIKSK